MVPSLFPIHRATLSLVFLAGSVVAGMAQESPSDPAQVVHVLNRITFGPRPGDVAMVQKMGLRNYIQQQLHPETIDDSAVEREVAQFEILQMTETQLMDIYKDDLRKILKKQMKIAEQIAAEKLAANSSAPAQNMTAPISAPSPMEEKDAMTGQGKTESPAATPKTSPEQEMDKAAPAQNGAQMGQWSAVAAIGQIEQAKLVRAIDSQRQLQEVLVDFWSNHFNIDVKKKLCSALKVADDRDVIRPHIWGKFRDLLGASAKSPAMLYYLDNASSSVGHTVTPKEQQKMEEMATEMKQNGAAAIPEIPAVGQKRGGINENYARELMELHTIGVDGGYTQQDVQEVARCFTGWSVDRQTGEFAFHVRQHDNGAKIVLGHNIPAGGGMQDGEIVLDILASSPACAKFISRELCQRFVADDPSPVLVNRIAGVFTSSGGDLRTVTDAILSSPEFLSSSSYGNKIKSPLEFTVSAVRASGATIVPQPPPPIDKFLPAAEGAAILGKGGAAEKMAKRPRQSLNFHIYELGQPLFACTPPTGYKEVSSTWVSPGALIERLNFAMAFTGQKVSDIHFDSSKILAGVDVDKPDAVLNQCVSVLLQNNISDSTRKVLKETALPAAGTGQTVDSSKLIALIIGSPEFQRK